MGSFNVVQAYNSAQNGYLTTYFPFIISNLLELEQNYSGKIVQLEYKL